MNPIIVTFAVLAVAIVLFVWNRVPVGIVAIGVALSLYLTGVLTADQALAGFGDPVIVFIAAPSSRNISIASLKLNATPSRTARLR